MAAPQNVGVVRLYQHKARNVSKNAGSSQTPPRSRRAELSVNRQVPVAQATTPPATGVTGGVGPEPDAATLLDDAVQTALDSLVVLEQHAGDLAARFRRGEIAQANHGLVDLLQSTQTMLVLASVAAGIAGEDLESLCETGSGNVDEQTRDALNRMIACEEAQDWTGVADALDEQLVPALARWRAVFAALSGRSPEPPRAAA